MDNIRLNVSKIDRQVICDLSIDSSKLHPLIDFTSAGQYFRGACGFSPSAYYHYACLFVGDWLMAETALFMIHIQHSDVNVNLLLWGHICRHLGMLFLQEDTKRKDRHRKRLKKTLVNQKYLRMTQNPRQLQTCHICYENQDQWQFKCQHSVCFQCAQEIIQNDDRCPFCRASLKVLIL